MGYLSWQETTGMEVPMTNALVPAPSNDPVDGVEERLLLPARRAGYDLPVIGTSEEPAGDAYWQGPTGSWWLITDRRTDPTAEIYGGVVVPEAEREKLVRLLREGFAPDRILIGHEMGPRWTPGDPIPDFVPKRPSAPQGLQRADLAVASTKATMTLGHAAVTATKALFVGAVAVGSAVGQALSELDPVIIAGVRDPRSGAVTWVEVARWNW